MNPLVVDASVAVKWYLPEHGSQTAREVLNDASVVLLAPDLIFAEVAQVLWKGWRSNRIEANEAERILRSFLNAPITFLPIEPLIYEAWRLATATGATVYDSLYLATAVGHAATLWTADQALAQRAFASGVRVQPLSG